MLPTDPGALELVEHGRIEVTGRLQYDFGDASRGAKWHAVRVANIDEFIESLPLGFNTKIGMEGTGISVITQF